MNKKTIILIVIIIIIIGGFLSYKYWWIPNKEAQAVSFLDESLNKIKSINSINYQIIIIQNTPGDNDALVSKSNIWMKEENGIIKVKNELVQSGPILKKYITLWDSGEKLWYFYSPENNFGRGGKVDYGPEIFEGTRDKFMEEIETIKQGHPVIIGQESFNGKNCLVVKYLMEKQKTKFWIWLDYGIIIKDITKASDGRSIEIKRENIEINTDIFDNLFKLPEGVQIGEL